MKNYYDILEISKDIDTEKIKGAYYKMVRKYPPERFPEEFKQLHEAYETLSDTEKRKKYDSMISMPESAYSLYEQAQTAKKQGQHLEAEKLMKAILKTHPKLSNIKAELIGWYENENTIGKAIKLMESLYNDDPKNSEHSLKLAELYLHRGWKKKSLAMFEKAQRLDPKSESAWMGIIQASSRPDEIEKVTMLYNKARKSLEEHGVKGAGLSFMMLLIYAKQEDESGIEACLKDIVDALQSNTRSNYIVSESLNVIFSVVIKSKNLKLIPYMRKIVDLIPESKDLFEKDLEQFELICLINTIGEKGYDLLFHDLLGTKLENCDCDTCRFEIMSMECNILFDLNKFRPQILQLQKEYPQLYDLHSNFFKEVMLCRDPESLLYKRLKTLAKNGYSPAFLSSEFAEPSMQTVRRESEKIGRNDPCPCGSGKKYKKCCGQ